MAPVVGLVGLGIIQGGFPAVSVALNLYRFSNFEKGYSI